MKSPSDAPVALSARWGRAVLLVGSVLFIAFAPVPICPTRNWLHLPCPGCGATRAIFLALRGDVAGSLRMHPLAIAAAVLLIPTALIVLRGVVTTGEAPKLPRWLRAIWYVFVSALIVLWLLRFAGLFGGPVPLD